jgi:hypothetical protein
MTQSVNWKGLERKQLTASVLEKLKKTRKKKKTPWPQSASELYRPSDHRTRGNSDMFNVAIFWNIAPCSPSVNQRFGGTYHLHLECRKIVA